MNDEMRQALEKIDKLISEKGFVYALIMARIEDESIATANIEITKNGFLAMKFFFYGAFL